MSNITECKRICEHIVNFLNDTCDPESLSTETPWYYTYNKHYFDEDDVPFECSRDIEMLVENTYDVICETEYTWFDLSYRQLHIYITFSDCICFITNITLREDDFKYVYDPDEDGNCHLFIDYIRTEREHYYPDLKRLKVFSS